MKKLIPIFIVLAAGIASAEWKLNPYTQRQDYYEAKASIAASTGTLTIGLAAEIARATAAEAAIAVDTGTLTTGLATEISNRQIADLAIGVTTGTLRTDLNSEISRATIREDAIGASTGAIYAALNSTASALTTETAARIARDLELIPSTATGTYPHLASLNLPLTGGTLTGPLTLEGSSLTVTGNGSFASAANFLAIGRTAGIYMLDVNATAGIAATGVSNLGGITGALTIGGDRTFTDGRYSTAIKAINDGESPSFYNPRMGLFVQDTGTYLPANVTEKVSIKGNGSVGIGTTTPDQKLTVAGNISATGQVISSGTGSNYFAGPTLVTDDQFSVGTSTFVVTGGKVGVGVTPTSAIDMLGVLQVRGTTATPAFPSAGSGLNISMDTDLTGDVAGASAGTVRLQAYSWDSPGYRNIEMRGATLDFKIGATTKMAVDSNGSVGIGTTAPASKLHISSGIVRVDGTLGALDGYVPAYYANTVNNTASLILNPQGLNVGGLQVVNSNNSGGARTGLINAGAELVTLRDAKVGVGTTAPVAKLDVRDGVIISSTTAGFGTVAGYGSSGGCLMFRDTDNAGWTECKFLDGVMTCATDADGVCD